MTREEAERYINDYRTFYRETGYNTYLIGYPKDFIYDCDIDSIIGYVTTVAKSEEEARTWFNKCLIGSVNEIKIISLEKSELFYKDATDYMNFLISHSFVYHRIEDYPYKQFDAKKELSMIKEQMKIIMIPNVNYK